jgi:hypothetical protein
MALNEAQVVGAVFTVIFSFLSFLAVILALYHRNRKTPRGKTHNISRHMDDVEMGLLLNKHPGPAWPKPIHQR